VVKKEKKKQGSTVCKECQIRRFAACIVALIRRVLADRWYVRAGAQLLRLPTWHVEFAKMIEDQVCESAVT
jgi:hypothetical protein